MSRSPHISWRLGSIGFGYADWTGVVYPPGVSGADRLSYYAEQFNAVEIDATFHAIPARKTVRRWGESVPDSFRFCVKTPRDITHSLTPGHLLSANTRSHMHQFLSTASELGDKLSVVLMQFPATFGADRFDELARFLHQLPDMYRYAVELRDDAWWEPRTAELLRELGVCWGAGDEVRKHEAPGPPGTYRPRPIVPTAEFLYIRWIGWHEQFPDTAREYLDPTARLRWWADRLGNVLDKRPEITGVFGFIGNGYSGHAPATCRRFQDAMGLPDESRPVSLSAMPLFGDQVRKKT